MSHLRGRKHQAALALLPPTSVPEGEELLIVDASEEQQSPAKCRQEVAERLQAGRKRARKLRQRLSSKLVGRREARGGRQGAQFFFLHEKY